MKNLRSFALHTPEAYTRIVVDDLTVLSETAKAVLVTNPAVAGAWLPKSQIEPGGLQVGQKYSIKMPRWLAQEKDFVLPEPDHVADALRAGVAAMQATQQHSAEYAQLHDKHHQLEQENAALKKKLEELQKKSDESVEAAKPQAAITESAAWKKIEERPREDMSRGIAKLPLRPARDTSVWVLDEDLVGGDVP